MKKSTLIALGIITVIFVNSLALSAQVKEENSIEPGRKYPPMSISSISANNGINIDAPAGSIAVAENTVYNAYTASQLVQNVLITGCITATNVRFGYYVKSGSSWNWTNHAWSATAGDRQMAYFNKASSTFPLTEGIVLTTGKASSAMGPNNTGSKSDQMVSTASDPDLANITGKTMYDAAVLEFDFVPSGNTVEFTYVFSSEEYLEYCETQFNDAFGFFLSGPAISGSYTNNSVNLATIPGNIPVSVNTIHPAGTNINNVAFAAENAQYYVDYPANTTTMQYDGSTVVLTATYTVSPCSTYRIRMAVADASDQKWDAGVFLGARSFNSENLNLVNFGNFIEGQNNVFEGCNNKFRIQRTNPDISQPITLNLILSGTFTNGVDIQTTGNQPFPTQVTIPANTSFIDIPYTAISDNISDNGETLIIKTASSCPCAATVVYVTQTINIYEQVVINSISATNAQCNNQSNGTIVANVSGGSGSYLFSINGGTTWQSLNSFSGLAAGTYTVTIQEPGSCHANISGTATIGNPSPIVANAGPDVSICAGSSTQLAGGGGVLYNWTPTTGLNFSNIANPIASPSVTTEYTLTTTSASGQCASTDNIIVTVLPLAVSPASVSVNRQIVCNDDNGNIILSATGGSGSTLEWFAGSCGSSVIGTGNNLSIASPTESTHYFARWTNGCGSSACAEVTVSVPTAIAASISSGNIACNGGSTVITVTASGGTGALQYSLNGGTYQSASTFTVNGTGSPYTVTVKDANNCTVITNTLAVTGPSAIAFGPSSVTNVSCTGGNNGQIIISATGGTGTINYSIVPNTGTQSPSGTFNNLTAQSYTITAQDQNGCTKNTIVIVGTIPDITPPTLVTCPPNQSANANSNCQASVPDYTALISATDNCTSAVNLSITQIPAAGSLVTTGITPVIITVKDAANNSVVCNTTFTVTDATAPVILTCAPAVTASANSNCQAVVPDFTSHITATDNCTSVSSLVITQSPIAGTLVATGVTTVTITVTDATGHTANCSATFTVTDTQNPTISGPGNITVNADPEKCYASSVSLGSPVTSDNCGIATVSNNAPAQFPVGFTTVIWTATDLSGLTATSTQIVTVIDNQPPTIICPPTVIVNAIIGQTYATGIILGSAITNDNCGVASVTNNAAVQFQVGSTTVTWTVTDVNGHTATCTQTVIVIDTQAPVLVCPSSITVNCGSEIPAAYTTLSEYIAAGGTVTANDEINASSFTLLSQTSNGQTCPETITRVYTIADVSNNYGTCSQQIIIQDITAPVVAAGKAAITGAVIS
jgi:plastocyanin